MVREWFDVNQGTCVTSESETSDQRLLIIQQPCKKAFSRAQNIILFAALYAVQVAFIIKPFMMIKYRHLRKLDVTCLSFFNAPLRQDMGGNQR